MFTFAKLVNTHVNDKTCFVIYVIDNNYIYIYIYIYIAWAKIEPAFWKQNIRVKEFPHERPLNFTSICLVDSSSLVCPPSGGLVFVKPKTWMVPYLLLFKSHNSFFINKLLVKSGLNFVCWFIVSKSSWPRSTIYSFHIPYSERSCKFSDELTRRKKKWHHEAFMVISNSCHFTGSNIYRHSKEI